MMRPGLVDPPRPRNGPADLRPSEGARLPQVGVSRVSNATSFPSPGERVETSGYRRPDLSLGYNPTATCCLASRES